jgi:hypothetical protein
MDADAAAAPDPLDLVFAALSDPIRRSILERLDGNSLLVSEIAAAYAVSPRPAPAALTAAACRPARSPTPRSGSTATANTGIRSSRPWPTSCWQSNNAGAAARILAKICQTSARPLIAEYILWKLGIAATRPLSVIPPLRPAAARPPGKSPKRPHYPRNQSPAPRNAGVPQPVSSRTRPPI